MDAKKKNTNKLKNREKQNICAAEKCRVPFKDLTRTCSRDSTISSSSSMEAPPKCCPRFLLSSSNSNSSSTSSSSSNIPKEPKVSKFTKKIINTTSVRTPKSVPGFSVKSRSKENNFPTKLVSQKPQKNPPRLYQWQSNKKSNSKAPGESNRCSRSGDSFINSSAGRGEFGDESAAANVKQNELENCQGKHLVEKLKAVDNCGTLDGFVENRTPTGKMPNVSGSKHANFDHDENNVSGEGGNSSTKMKTPPVEASVSPEIQFGGASSAVLVSAATPTTCYGAGHLLSGVTDKRKCRARGILTIGDLIASSGCRKDNLFEDGKSDIDCEDVDGRVLGRSRNSLAPLPAEASMHWLLSPCKEDDEGSNCDVPSSPSMCYGTASDLVRDSVGNYSIGNSNVETPNSSGKTRIVLFSPRGIPEVQGDSAWDKDGYRSIDSETPDCKAVLAQDGRKNQTTSLTALNSPGSIGSLSSGNVIQTPSSDSISDKYMNISWFNTDTNRGCLFESELNSGGEVLQKASLSPRSQMSTWDLPGQSFQRTSSAAAIDTIELVHLKRNLESPASWASDSPFENSSQSQIRISWREGLTSRIFEMDDSDCCRFLSDEENEADGCTKNNLKSHQDHEMILLDDTLRETGLRSPEFLQEEPRVHVIGKEKLSHQRPSSCAESISTVGGSLFASGDSDWSFCYKNQLFQD